MRSLLLALALAGACAPSDDASPDDAPVDTDLAPAVLPETLGPGFREVLREVLGADGYEVFGGQREGGLIPVVDSIASLGDLDGDGQPEVVVGGFRAEDGAPTDQELTRVLRWDGVGLAIDPTWTAALAGWGDVAGVVDVDGDGEADVLGRSLGALVRYGDGEVLALGAPDDVVAATPVDLDADGWLDLLLVRNGCLEPGPALRVAWRTGPRRYEVGEVSDVAGLDWYATLAVPLADEPMVVMPLGGECEPDPFPGFARIISRDAVGRPILAPVDVTPADALYKQSPFVAGGPLTRGHPMGAAVGDLDGDAVLDLVVPTAGDHVEVFLGAPTLPLIDHAAAAGLTNPEAASGPPRYQIPWGTALVDLDRDGRHDVVAVHGNDRASWERQDLGPQRLSAWWNDGRAVFTDVTALTGIDDRGQWRSLTVGDLDGDGDPELLVGGQGRPPRLYLNEIDVGGSFGLRLRGTTSNALGLGARVRVEVDGLPVQTLVVGGQASPLIASEPWLFPSTGAAAAARVVITWPTGLEQRVTLEAGRVHTVTEPEVVRIAPAGRAAPADGASTQVLTVQGAEVAARVLAGAPATVGAPVETDDGWQITVTAPGAPGSTRLELTVDGRVLGVTPRLWWE